MDWVIVGASVFALAAGVWVGTKASASATRSALGRAETSQAHDRHNYLSVLRRELANLLIWRDPDRYLRLYELVHAQLQSNSESRLDMLRSRLSGLCEKYPHYSDFDALGTRDYVLYLDAADMLNIEDLERRYQDIVTFIALSIVTDKEWQFFHATSDKELVHLRSYVQRIKDTLLRARLEQAIHERYIGARAENADFDSAFETAEYSVRHVHHFAETRFGIYVKKTNDFGIYGIFYADDGRKFEKYYRSDPTFEKEQRLHVLHSVLEEPIRRLSQQHCSPSISDERKPALRD